MNNSVIHFEPIRAAARARLADFLPAAGRYAAERNFVRPGHDHVARLSPWLQKRLLLESEVVATALGEWTWPAVEKFVQEVYWRTYWKGWLEQRPAAWVRWTEAVPRLRDGLRGERRSAWEAACAGRTGIAGFDDWARELVATGYLHNHARMWFASIWIFTLRLPWELGAAFFYEHLLDGDAASNTLSWRWVAGLQTAGKTYVARADNIAHYTEGRCAPAAAQLASAAFAITEEPLPKVAAWAEDGLWTVSAGAAAGGDAGKGVGLWLHAEDLAVEVGELAGEKFAAVNAAWPTGIAARAGWSEGVAAWTRAALADGAARASGHFGAETATGATDDLEAELVGWARAKNLRRVVAYRPFVGPWLDEALAAERALGAAGVAVTWRRRAWDTELFPHAGRGYFPFWERVKAEYR
jgi:deoxyribodipyrimidine photo-lyase